MDREAWRAAVHEVAEGWTRLIDWTTRYVGLERKKTNILSCRWYVCLWKTLRESVIKQVRGLKTQAQNKKPCIYVPAATDHERTVSCFQVNWCLLCRERLEAGGEGDNRKWDGWMASPTRWTGVWAGSRSWWWTGRPGVLQSVGPQRDRHDWATELNWMFTIFPALLRYNWQVTLCKFEVYNVVMWCTITLWNGDHSKIS